MAQMPMYQGMVNSPQTELATAIDDTQTTIDVQNGDSLPDAPNLAVIIGGELSETILYTEKTGNTLSGITRGFQGEARGWSQGTKIARNGTEYDHQAFKNNIEELEGQLSDITPVSIGAETPQGAQDKADAAKTEAKQDAKTNLDTHLLDYVRQPAFAVTTGTGSAYTVTLNPAPINLVDGFGITIVPHVVNAANPTLNINGLGAIALKDQKGVAYTADKLQVGKPYTFRYVGTDFLADSVAGGGGSELSTLDFSAYSTHCKWDNTDVNVPATTWSTFLSVTGTGVLNFVRSFFVDFVSNTPDMRIIVDGTTYNIAGSTLSGARASWGAAFVAPISFGTSLVIQLYNNQSIARKLCLHYTYLLQAGIPSSDQTVLLASQRRLVVTEITTASWTTVVNVTGMGYLLGIEFEGSSVPSSGNFSINATVQIDNVNIKGNEGVFGSGAIARHIVFNGPVRFNTRLMVQNYNTAPASGTGITKVYYILD